MISNSTKFFPHCFEKQCRVLYPVPERSLEAGQVPERGLRRQTLIAVHLAALGSRRYEVFCEETNVNEQGFTATSQIFGGLIENAHHYCWPTNMPDACEASRKRDPGRLFLIFEPWPSRLKYMLYIQNAYCIVSDAWDYCTWVRYKRVSVSFVAKLFKQDFWDSTVPREDRQALLPPTIGEWTFWPSCEGSIEPARWKGAVAVYGQKRALQFCPCHTSEERRYSE